MIAAVRIVDDHAGLYVVAVHIEADPVSPALRPKKILLYHWNRVYPADELFVYPGGQDRWECLESTDFSGFSHPKITEEVLIPKEV